MVQIHPDPPLVPSARNQPTRGAVAQLGEHLPCTQGVRSSILLGSTIRGSIVRVGVSVGPLVEASVDLRCSATTALKSKRENNVLMLAFIPEKNEFPLFNNLKLMKPCFSRMREKHSALPAFLSVRATIVRCAWDSLIAIPQSAYRGGTAGISGESLTTISLTNVSFVGLYGQVNKRIWWMPWQLKAMKDVVACDKPRGAGKQALIRGFPNGETRRS